MTPESLLKESLALVSTKDIQLHKVVFFMPFEPVIQKLEKKSLKWPRADDRDEAGAVLRQNIRFMINKTKHFGLLLSQLTWVGLMNFAEKRRVVSLEFIYYPDSRTHLKNSGFCTNNKLT